jgi:hypothetical protein
MLAIRINAVYGVVVDECKFLTDSAHLSAYIGT